MQGAAFGWVRAAALGGLSALGAGLVLAIITAPGAADAKSAYESPYGYERTWNAALRLVRVDNGWKVTEKDDQSGYLIFEYRSPESTKATPGSLELVRASHGEGTVSVLVQLPQMPRYHEQVLLDALASKMRHEYGDPPARKPTDEARPEPVDAGAD
jgi:hypothetical protein